MQVLTPAQVSIAIVGLADNETLNYKLTTDDFIIYTITKLPFNLGLLYTVGPSTEFVGGGAQPPQPPILLTPILYADLVALIGASNLVAGAKYLMTDFRVLENIPNTADQHSGIVEPLIITALSNQRISTEVQSPTYPQDFLNYEIVDTTTQGGDMGRIYYRKDNVINISTYYDWRNIVFRRWETALASGIFTVLTDNGFAFQDFYTFNNSTIATNCKNSSIGVLTPAINGGLNNNIFGTNFTDNIIDSDSYNNTISDNFNENYIGINFAVNSIGNGFFGNYINNSFNGNTIGNNFVANKIGNDFANSTIGNNFTYNIVDAGFDSNILVNNCFQNIIESNFSNNTIGNNFTDNKISGGFLNNQINDNFTTNSVENNFSGFNLLIATWVYMPNFSKQILKNQGGTFTITFLSAGNVPLYDLPTN